MTHVQTNLNNSIEQLEGVKWPELPKDSAPYILECQRLRKIPIGDLMAEGMRLLLGQNIGLPYVVPLALDLLENDPWASGDHYEGDLRLNVLRTAPDYWSENPSQLDRLTRIMDKLDMKAKFIVNDLQPAWQKLFTDG